MKRRHFIAKLAGGVVGGAGVLAVGWAALPGRQRLTADAPLPISPGESLLNGWVKVSSDNQVHIFMCQAEMGQGIHTSAAMLLADEMDADWSQVRLEQSTLDKIYNNQAEIVDSLPFFQPDDNGATARFTRRLVGKIIREVPGAIGTGGSSSIKDLWLPMRQAGASARAALIAAAADTWKVAASECRAESGRVTHSSGKSATFGELAPRAAQLPIPKDVPLKDPSQFKLIGKPVQRIDRTDVANGTAKYSIDVKVPGMLYASIVLCPTTGGKATRFDDSAAKAVPGVRKVLSVNPYAGGLASYGAGTGGVAVVADSPWHAIKAARALKIDWDHGPAASVSTRDVFDGFAKALDANPGKVHFSAGDADTALKSAAKSLTAEYRAPFLAHATMEPMNCTVQFKDGAATVWGPAQGPGLLVRAVAGVLGIPGDKVRLVIPKIGGGFGRRTFVDVASQAAAIAKEMDGAPVQLLWTREQDMTHDYYRPAFVSRHKAGLDAQGNLVAWHATTAGSSMGSPSAADGSSMGAYDTGYAFPAARVAHVTSDSLVPVGIWRSVGHSYNAFFTESFMDELAAAAGKDPVAFREALLKENPRMLRVLRRAVELSGWKGKEPGRRIAIHRCFGSIVANVADVSVDEDKKIRVNRVICVLDCGTAVNPNFVRQQMQGGIIFGLSAALQGEITVENGQVRQQNFDTYAPLRMRECPAIEVDILPGTDEPGGIGETGVPTIAPAVANAVFSLTGQRLRSLPLRLS